MNNGSKGVLLDEEVIAELERYKAPSETDLNSVLRRLFELNCPVDQRGLIERASTSPRHYRQAILQALAAEGGEAAMTTIYGRVAMILADTLKPVDFESYDTDVRWKTAIRTVANSKGTNSMRAHGVIEYDKFAKLFRITERGRRELEYTRTSK